MNKSMKFEILHIINEHYKTTDTPITRKQLAQKSMLTDMEIAKICYLLQENQYITLPNFEIVRITNKGKQLFI